MTEVTTLGVVVTEQSGSVLPFPAYEQVSTEHAEELRRSCVATDVANERGYLTMGPTHRALLSALEFPGWAVNSDESYPMLFVPMYSTTGTPSAQVKPARPSDTGQKYASRRGHNNVLDVHPRNREAVKDFRTPLWITEGVKKADCLTSQGLCVIALSGVYNWRNKMGTLGDWEDVALKGRQVTICFDSDAVHNDQVLRAMSRLGKWLESRSVAEVRYLIVPESVGPVPVKGVDDFIAAGGTLQTLQASCLPEPPRPGDAVGVAYTDAFLSETIANEHFDGKWLYCAKLGGWMQWDGRRWRSVGTEFVTESLRKLIKERYEAAAKRVRDGDPGKDAKRELAGWGSVAGQSRVSALEKMMRGIFAKHPDEFDSYPMLLNVGNGVINLASGQRMPHDPDLLLTQCTAVDYVPAATHPDWSKALEALPPELHEWYQIRMGEACLGRGPADDALLVQSGGGSNGKSTIMEGISRALGDYAVTLDPAALTSHGNDRHKTEIARLMGRRLVLVEETPEGSRLNMNRLKQFVGTPRITARFMRQDEFEFPVQFTLIMDTNNLPMVEDTDDGSWRRLLRTIFPYRYRKPGDSLETPNDREGDPGVRRRMTDSPNGQHEAVLAWLVTGAVEYCRRSQASDQAAAAGQSPLQVNQVPDTVAAATMQWRVDSDSLLRFFQDKLEIDQNSWVTSADMLSEFNHYMSVLSQREWSSKLLINRAEAASYLSSVWPGKSIRTATPGRSVPRNRSGSIVEGEAVRAWVGVRFK